MSRNTTFYAQQMLNLHSKYGLSTNAKSLLRAIDDYKFGRIDQKELGRIVRLSKNMRRAVTDTIKKCALIMAREPDESGHCVGIIHACTEILTVADQPPPIEEFPLMKLPQEIRRNIYVQYLGAALYWDGGTFTTYPKKSDCACADYEPPSARLFQRQLKVNLALSRTSKQLRDEFLTFFYGRCTFVFFCACDMLEHLKVNSILEQEIKSIKLHWTGPVSDKAFATLSRCPKLKSLSILVSKATTKYLTKRETAMQRYFTTHKSPRLSDALGIDELLTIRGLDTVMVTHVHLKLCARRSEEERANLQALLRNKLILPKGSDGSALQLPGNLDT